MRRFLVAVLAVLVGTCFLASIASAYTPVDVRGTWVGQFESINAANGLVNGVITIATEDFSTGAVTGTASGGTSSKTRTWTLTGAVTGSALVLTFHLTNSTTTSVETMIVSPDGSTMTVAQPQGAGGTASRTLTRTGPAPSASPAPSALPTGGGTNGNPTCTFGGAGGDMRPIATGNIDSSVVRVVSESVDGQALFPSAVAIDTGDPRGRVFVTNFLSRAVTVLSGRPLNPADIQVQSTIEVGGFNAAVAVDPTTGHVFVEDQANCQIVVLDGRATPPSVIRTISLPGQPSDIAVDPTTGRLFVAFADLGQVLAIGPDLSTVPTTITVPGGPRRLVVDGARGLVFVARSAQAPGGATTGGSIGVIDGRADPPRLVAETAAAAPTALAVDGTRHMLFAVETGTGQLSSFGVAADGALTRLSSVLIDPDPAARTVAAIAVLPASHDVLVPLATANQANLFTVGVDGSLRLDRAVAGITNGVALAVDPATGRTFVAEPGQSSVVVAALDVAAAPAPSITAALPGPLEISLAPQDVARSIGITAFLMLLLGVPTPLFNSTLSAKRRLIERWLRRRLPRRMAASTRGAGVGRRIGTLSGTWPGMIVYLLLVTLLYAFLNAQFPCQNVLLTFGTTLFGIAAGTALSQVPAELYVRRHHHARGQIRVALWTLILAAGCVLVTRVTAVQPGYVYGIIGGFTFRVALSAEDRGRMAFRGMAVLLAVGFAAWFIRIPFQPTVGIIGGDVGSVGNSILANLFVSAVQGAAIGLIPLRFLTGETLFAWSLRRWAILWALALLLFAHVILYPVSSFEPHPSPTGLWTVALTVVLYGGIAIAFWAYFRRRDLRHQVRPTTRAIEPASSR